MEKRVSVGRCLGGLQDGESGILNLGREERRKGHSGPGMSKRRAMRKQGSRWWPQTVVGRPGLGVQGGAGDIDSG